MSPRGKRLSYAELSAGIQQESAHFALILRWIEEHMPASFFEEVDREELLLIAHALMHLDRQQFLTHILLKYSAYALCLDSPDADLRLLQTYRDSGLQYYRSFVSNVPPPFPGVTARLRIAAIELTSADEQTPEEERLSPEKLAELREIVKVRHPQVTEEEFGKLLQGIRPRFIGSLKTERLTLALDMFFRAQKEDSCQIEVRKNPDWQEGYETPSIQIVFAWRNVPKHDFLFRLAQLVHRYGLAMKRLSAAYIDPQAPQRILLMSLGIHGAHGRAAWEVCDIDEFLAELVMLKYFPTHPLLDKVFIESKLVSSIYGDFLKALLSFVHQALLHVDIHMYALPHIEEGLCEHPDLSVKLCEAFQWRFHPQKHDETKYRDLRDATLKLIDKIDSGNELLDTRSKNILAQAFRFIDATLKTNFFCKNKTALAFRLDPTYLNHLPIERKDKFPELPFAIFFMAGMDFIAFHIRFQDLARGGLRTVLPHHPEQVTLEMNNLFSECYGLAYTQQKKNKDIPEGGAKGVIFVAPYERLAMEEEIARQEFLRAGKASDEIEKRVQLFHAAHKLEALHASQRAYVESLITLVNCEADGKLKTQEIVDFWKRPEYIYLGPDEGMHNEMIEWIAAFAKAQAYKPGAAFITSKPRAGINHKEYGVTSLGVNVYVEEVLRFLRINPERDVFTVKMSGGPDGDVAGNEILNLAKHFPKTAKLIALNDVSGAIYDPVGLDYAILEKLFHEEKPIRSYPPEKLSRGGYLLDLETTREESAYARLTKLWRKTEQGLKEEWLPGSEMNALFRTNLHQTYADIFIPGGGRPRTLNDGNWRDFLDESGKPTARAIVEGANLYLTPWARRSLEKLGTLVIKDSSANKGGVIASSFEVLCGLVLSEEEFLKEKAALMPEILAAIARLARFEAKLLLNTYAKDGSFLTDISDQISERINRYTKELLDYLATVTLSKEMNDPLIRCLLRHCPETLRTRYGERILKEVPDVHKKAIIASFLSSRLVYHKGLSWSPSMPDVLPLIIRDPSIVESE